MPADDPREVIAGLMGRAKDDLRELVAFKSVADPKQYPPSECENAARWVVEAFAEVGVGDVAMSPTSDGSLAVHGHAPGPAGARERRAARGGRPRPPRGGAVHPFHGIGRGDRAAAGHHFVERDAEGEQLGARADRPVHPAVCSGAM